MARTAKKYSESASESSKKKRTAPARTVKGKEDQMIALAMDQAEKMLLAGNAPAQIVTHFLRLGTTREEYEKRKIEQDIKLSQAKIDAIESAKRVEELYAKAIKAMKSYSGLEDEEEINDE